MTIILPLLLTACNGDKHAQEVEESYQKGRDEGYAEGYEVGENDGFESGYDTGLEDGYDQGYDDGYTEATTIEDGWTLYAEGNYSEACSSFLYAAYDTGLDSNHATGLGWCNLRMNNIEIAEGWFEMAIAFDTNQVEAWIGLGSTQMLSHQYLDVMTSTDHILLHHPSYTSTIEDIDTQAIQTAQVLAYLFLQQNFEASITLQELDPTLSIHPLQSETWMIENVMHTSFQNAAIAKLQQLGAI